MQFIREIHAHLLPDNEHIWCHIEGEAFTYARLYQYCTSVQSQLIHSKNPIGVALRHDFETYASLIACWLNGKAYVPLNTTYPETRIMDILEASEISHVLDSQGADFSVKFGLNHISPEKNPPNDLHVVKPTPSDWAYILFTSGTTGKPKGVPISFGNLQAFFEGFFDLNYEVNSTDRFLQMFELTFDLSVMSFGVPSILGASFFVPSRKLVKPLALYDTLESQDITFALMVPSAVDLLAPYADELELPKLKVTQFCGEALKTNQVSLWKQACASTQIDNVYGPTEATIYCTRYTVPPDLNEMLHHHGIVCIGKPMKHVSLLISEDQELCLGGNQTTAGYLHATSEQKAKFFERHGSWFYYSGDTASFLDGNYYCHGRNDDQIKIQGYRVELAEIEFAAAKIVPEVSNRCIPIETTNGWELHLVYELDQTSVEVRDLNQYLPDYMHVKKVHAVKPFPLNENGKIDRKQLKTKLEVG